MYFTSLFVIEFEIQPKRLSESFSNLSYKLLWKSSMSCYSHCVKSILISFKIIFSYSKLKCKCSRLLTLCIQVFLCKHQLLDNIPFGQHRVALCIHSLLFVYKIHDMDDVCKVLVLYNQSHTRLFYRMCWVPGNSKHCGHG